MKKLALIAAAAAALSAPALAQQAATLKVHSFSSALAPEAVHHMLPLIEKLAKDTGGRLKLEFYPAMQLGGKPGDLIQQMEDGVVDIVITIAGLTPGRFAGLEGSEMPFTNVGTSAGQTAALLEWSRKWLMTSDFKNIKIVHMHTTDAAVLHTRAKPVKSLADFKGMKVRVPGRFVGEAVKALGGTPVGVPLGGIYEALERGQIDAMTINWAIMTPYKFQEVTKHHLETPMYQNAIMTLMRQASYDKLPADLKKALDGNLGIPYSVGIAKKIDELTVPAKQAITARGNSMYSIPEAERAKWVEAVKPVYAMWVGEMNKRGLPGQQMFDDLLALTAKHGRK